MIEIALNGVKKFYGANTILKGVTFEIQTGERAGIVGRNGAGKTTIFKIIAGVERQDGGMLHIRKGATVGYLDQIPEYPEDFRVIDVLNTVFADIFRVMDEMRVLEQEMSQAKRHGLAGQELDKVMKKYGDLQHTLEHMGGYEMGEKLGRVCTGLKISDEFKERNFATLSGGEKTKVVLGKMLLQNPDILLLDEPTNHLDMEAVEWLEEFLAAYRGTVLVISHDRYFLDRVVTKVVEIEEGEAVQYQGNYSSYVREREKRLLAEFEAYEDRQKKIKAMEEAIKRYHDWGLRSDNPKFHKKAASIRKRLEKIEELERPVLERARMQLKFSGDERSGNEVIRIKGLKKGFRTSEGEKAVLSGLDFHVGYGEKVAILGKNGTGKTTLMKILLNLYLPDEGEVKLGANVKPGYLEQEVIFEHEEFSILETFRDRHPLSEEEARNRLAKFLFYGEDVFKKVKNLSGGEKSRLKLCLLMQEEINLLLLDEPTNHLDIDSREVLEEALADFQGTVVFISHDRYFINKIAGRIAELTGGKFRNYLGNYDYYRAKKGEEMETGKEGEEPGGRRRVEKPGKEKPAAVERNRSNELKRRERRLNKLEEEIELLEKSLTETERLMEEHADDYLKLEELFKEKTRLQEALDALLEEWMGLISLK